MEKLKIKDSRKVGKSGSPKVCYLTVKVIGIFFILVTPFEIKSISPS